MQQLSFFVSGIPAPQPRPRMTRHGHAYNPPTADAWKATIAMVIERDHKGKTFGKEAVSVVLYLHIPRPKSHFNAKGQLKPNAPMVHTQKPDVDNYAKAILDQLVKSGVMHDDSQITGLVVVKKWNGDGNHGAYIAISAI